MPTKRKTKPDAATEEAGGQPIDDTTEAGGAPVTGLSPEAEKFRARAMEIWDASEAQQAEQLAPKRELSGPWASPQIAEIQADWPARRQPVTLACELSEEEIVEQAHILTAALNGFDIIKSEAKSSADAYKARLEEQQSAINRSRALIDRGTDEREVECVWVYETAGVDAEGRVIIDSERRTLVRLDTGTVVRHERIPEEDRQLSLFPEEPEAPVADDPDEFAQLTNDQGEFVQEAATGEEAP